MRHKLLFGVVVLLGASPGCDAIPINLPDPGLSDGGVSDTQKGGSADGEGVGGDVPAPAGPDVGFSPVLDASWSADAGLDGGLDGAWLPDACITDGGSGDALCPPPPGDGGLDDGGPATDGPDRDVGNDAAHTD